MSTIAIPDTLFLHDPRCILPEGIRLTRDGDSWHGRAEVVGPSSLKANAAMQRARSASEGYAVFRFFP